MITEFILIGVIVILSLLLGWKEREARLERNKLVNALLAKNAQDMVNLELVDKTKINIKPQEPEFIDTANLPDDYMLKNNG